MNYSHHNTLAHYFQNENLAPYIFALSKKMQDGHVCLDLDKMPDDEEFWQEFDGKRPERLELAKIRELTTENDLEQKPFTLFGRKLYISRNFFYESQIVKGLRTLTHTDSDIIKYRCQSLLDNKSFIEKLQSRDPDAENFSEDERPDFQLIAAIQGVINNLTVITGGPGTGKTTTVAKILSLLNKTENGLKIALAAPTGKAAVRMKESLLNTISDPRNNHLEISDLIQSLEPKTIHRLLGSIHESPFFKSNTDNPLDYDVVIIDESSMIGVGLFAKLIQAVKPSARLILLGDSEQLASVDSGSLFGDLCKVAENRENKFSEERVGFINQFLKDNRKLERTHFLDPSEQGTILDEHLIRLKKTYRYDQNSKMGQFTKAVIKGESSRLKTILQINEKSLKHDETYSEDLFHEFVSGYSAFIEESDIYKSLSLINNLRVLCAVREGDHGIYAVNRKIESILKKRYSRKEQTFSPSAGFYHNQPVMVTSNMSNLNLFNGDIGLVRMDKTNGILKAFFPDPDNPGNVISVNPALISNWETVFAMTIHKSQGSEFREVMVILPQNKSSRLLTRELLYTAVTRAKEKAIIQSSLEILENTTKSGIERVSGIQSRILKTT